MKSGSLLAGDLFGSVGDFADSFFRVKNPLKRNAHRQFRSVSFAAMKKALFFFFRTQSGIN
jgi:hypothetical protein